MSNKEKAIQPKVQPEIAQLPALSSEDRALMFGDMEQEDITIPRLTVLQSMSPEVADGLGRPGDIFIKGLQQNLGREPIEVIPILRSKSRIRWRELTQGGGILCRSTEGKTGVGSPGGDCSVCPEAGWKGDAKPNCTLYQNVIVVLRKESTWFPLAISGGRTKLKALKDFNALLLVEQNKGRFIFSKSYLLSMSERINQAIGAKYFNFALSPTKDNALLPPEEQRKAFDVFQALKGKTIDIAHEAEEGVSGGEGVIGEII